MENIEDAKVLSSSANQKKIPTETIGRPSPWATGRGDHRGAERPGFSYRLLPCEEPYRSVVLPPHRSMDAGYDPLIKTSLFGQKRIITLEDIKEKPTSKDLAPKYAKVLEILKKQDKTAAWKRKTFSPASTLLGAGYEGA